MKIKISNWLVGFVKPVYIKRWKDDTAGYTNYCFTDGKYIPMLDLDNTTQKEAEIICTKLVNKFKLSDFYLFKSNTGTHAVCLSKLPLHEIRQVYDFVVENDTSHSNIGYYNKKWVLRLTDKKGQSIKYLSVVYSPYQYNYEKSKAHYTLLSKIADLTQYGINFDIGQEIETAHYKT